MTALRVWYYRVSRPRPDTSSRTVWNGPGHVLSPLGHRPLCGRHRGLRLRGGGFSMLPRVGQVDDESLCRQCLARLPGLTLTKGL